MKGGQRTKGKVLLLSSSLLALVINPQRTYAKVTVISLSVCQHLISKTVAFEMGINVD